MESIETPAPARSKYYWKAVGPFKEILHRTVSSEQLVALPEKNPAIHLAYAARQFAIVAVCAVILYQDQPWWIAAPLIVLQGFTFFNMTTLLHEVVHSAVFRKTNPPAERVLGLLYAITSGISRPPSSPAGTSITTTASARTTRTPSATGCPQAQRALVQASLLHPGPTPIYFRAAAQEVKSYPEALRRTIARERMATIAIQLSIGGALYYFGGVGAMLRVWFLPYFIVFPIAFAINRLGPALLHRPEPSLSGPHGHAALRHLGFPVRLLQLPRRASLLPRASPSTTCAASHAAPRRCTPNSGSSLGPTARSSGNGCVEQGAAHELGPPRNHNVGAGHARPAAPAPTETGLRGRHTHGTHAR